METNQLEGISKEWLREYERLMYRFGLTIASLRLCETRTFRQVRREIESRVQRLSDQHITRARGY